MAKKKDKDQADKALDKDEGPTTAEKTDKPLAPFLAKLLKANEKKLGAKNVYIGSETRVIGIEPYSLALQYLMDLMVIPLQSIITIAGEPKSYKTSALLEMCKLAMELGGLGVVVNTEGKWSDSKVTSMLGPLATIFQRINAASVEQWQETATHYLKTLGDIVQKRKEARDNNTKNSEYYNMTIPPMIIGVDSLTGAQSDSVQGKVFEEGSGAKTFQDRAMINWQWFNTWGSNLIGMPATVVIVQHLKDKIDNASALPQKITGGGTGGSFMCSMEIRIKNVGNIDKTYVEGAYLQWRMHFNSLGRDKRSIKVPYYEAYDENDQQVAYFDWDECLVLMLLERLEESLFKSRILEVTGNITEYSKPGTGKVYSCEALDITKQRALDEEMTASKLGKLLQAPGSEIRTKLQKALRIQPAIIWKDELF